VEGELVSVEKGVKTRFSKDAGQVVYRLEDERGVLLTVFGSAILTRRMANVAVGDWLKLSYTGEIATPNGKAKVIDVEVIRATEPQPEEQPAY